MSIEVRFRNLHHKKFKRLERRRKFSVGIEEKHAAHPTRTHPADFAYRRSSSFIQMLDAASHRRRRRCSRAWISCSFRPRKANKKKPEKSDPSTADQHQPNEFLRTHRRRRRRIVNFPMIARTPRAVTQLSTNTGARSCTANATANANDSRCLIHRRHMCVGVCRGCPMVAGLGSRDVDARRIRQPERSQKPNLL